MGKHRRHTNLEPTEFLKYSFLAAIEASERVYGCQRVSTVLYLLTLFGCVGGRKLPKGIQFVDQGYELTHVALHPAVWGLVHVGIDLEIVLKNFDALEQEPVAVLPDGFTEEFKHVRREAINLAQDMGEKYFDIGHMILAAMRKTDIFHGVDKSMIREYKATYCKAANVGRLLAIQASRAERAMALLDQIKDQKDWFPPLAPGESMRIDDERVSERARHNLKVWIEILTLLYGPIPESELQH